MNKKQKELIKIYIFLFLVIYVIINWDTVSWAFNYKEVSGLAYAFFNPYQESPLLTDDFTVPNQNTRLVFTQNAKTAGVLAIEENYPYSDKSDSLEIPTIGLVTPLVIGESTDVAALEKDLDNGVVYYPGFVLPGENGQIVVLGHSAPPGWPHIKHDWVFTDISKLQTGDQIILYFNNKQYIYNVISKDIIKQGQDITSSALSANNNILAIVSCWPPGKNYERILVQAELLLPSGQVSINR